MSEKERKGKHKAARIISITALVIGIATFLVGLLLVPITLWIVIFPFAGGEGDVIGLILLVVAFLPILCSIFLWPIAAIGLVLSIVTLFIEWNKCLRLLPLAFSIAGIWFYATHYFTMAFH
ncbi:MAG: hypothetical protein ACYTDW_01670 [Planctomycetota bacterium]|jgi:hypothetical protein